MKVGYRSINPITYFLGLRRTSVHIMFRLGGDIEKTHLEQSRLNTQITYRIHPRERVFLFFRKDPSL